MKIVVVSPHPDDETLGAGGLILKRKDIGDQIYWINITDVSIDQGWSQDFVEHRQKQIQKICEFYKFDNFYNLKFKPSTLENEDKNKIISAFNSCIQNIKPEWIVLPNHTDSHNDHKITFEVGMTCTKKFRCPSIKKILTMEILSETEFCKTGEAFSPNYFVDITNYFVNKLEALKIYDTEIYNHPFPRSEQSVKALATLRGAMAGCMYGEAFKIIKEID